jgi:hypothetical protein
MTAPGRGSVTARGLLPWSRYGLVCALSISLVACSSEISARAAEAEAVHQNLRVGMTWNEVATLARGVKKGGLSCRELEPNEARPCAVAVIMVEGAGTFYIILKFGPDGRVTEIGSVEWAE